MTNGILATTITAINGTTVTLATSAVATATSQWAQHDNTPIVYLGCAALPSYGGGELRIPATSPIATVLFNSPLDLYHYCTNEQLTISSGSRLGFNDPVIMKQAGTTFTSVPGAALAGNQFQFYSSTSVAGAAYPFFYFVPGSFGPNTITNMSMECDYAYQSCVVQDGDGGGGGVANISYDNDTFSGNAGAMPMIMRSGGFNFNFNHGTFQVNSGAWGVPEALQITTPNPLSGTDNGYGNGNGFSISSILTFDKVLWAGHGIEYNDWGRSIVGVAGNATFTNAQMESGFSPWMTVHLSGANTLLTDMNIIRSFYADFLSGSATPYIMFGSGVRLGSFVTEFASCASGQQPLFEGNILGGLEVTQGTTAGCALFGTNNMLYTNLSAGVGATVKSFSGANASFSHGGKLFYVMGLPAAPASTVVSAGGADPVGSNCYSIFVYDSIGGYTTNGPGSCVTTTTGNQTVTITKPVTLPAGATAWNVTWTGPSGGQAYLSCLPISSAITTFVHFNGGSCGNPFNAFTTAGSTYIGSAGIATNQLLLTGNGFSDTFSGSFTANRTQTLPDVTGILETTAYVNSWYDNFNRANGAIGSNWVVLPFGGFNISSDAAVGTSGGANVAYIANG